MWQLCTFRELWAPGRHLFRGPGSTVSPGVSHLLVWKGFAWCAGPEHPWWDQLLWSGLASAACWAEQRVRAQESRAWVWPLQATPCDSCHSPHCDKADDETSLESISVNVSATEELLILHPHYLLPLWSPVPPPLTSHVKDMDSQCGKAMDQAMSWCPTATTKLCSCTRQLLLLSFYLRSTCQEGDRNFVVFYLIPETSLHPDVWGTHSGCCMLCL